MTKRVKFKNATTRPNKRVRVTHDENASIDVGQQTGAIYYEAPELGMCYSKPMEITVTNKEETQCVSLVGLYDLFIDGKRIGRGLTQQQILERVNAGSYGVEAVACNTVSCEGAPSQTNCVSLTGKWNVEINDIRIVDNADEARILAALKKNQWITAETCAPACTPTGKWTFTAEKLSSHTFAVGSSIRLFIKMSNDEVGDVYRDITFTFQEDTIEYKDAWVGNTITFGWREASTNPWNGDGLLRALAIFLGPEDGLRKTATPEGWFNGSLGYCRNDELNVTATMYVTNMYALDKSVYTYTGGFNLDFAGMLSVTQLRLNIGTYNANEDGAHPFATYGDAITLEPFTWDASAQTKEQTELLLLNHYKTQLELHGFECTIVPNSRKNIPPAYYSGPDTSLHDLVISATFPFMLTPSEQWEGTVARPELKNETNGWDLNSVGLNITSQSGNGGTAYGRINGCKNDDYETALEVGASVTYEGFNASYLYVVSNQRPTYRDLSTSFTIVSAESEGVVLPAGQVDFVTIFPECAGEENTIYSCGYYDVQQSEAK